MSVQAVNSEYVITTDSLYKDYEYYKKEVGLKGSIKNVFHKEKLYKHAVSDLNLQISRGSIVGLIGLNGAGKTTTLKMLSGIINPTRGNVNVLGFCPFDKKQEYLKRIAMIMGNKSQLWWDIPAIDSFELNKTIYNVKDEDYKKILDQMISIMNVEEQLNVQVRRLSLGERMKMELIASLLYKPDVIFLDEPTIGLDVITQYNIREFLKEYCKFYNSTIILTSHNFNDIVSLCDFLVLINNGETIYSNTFNNFQKQFFNKKYFILKLKLPKSDGVVKTLSQRKIYAEKIDDYSIKISADNSESLKILKDITEGYIEQLNDINIENISMDDVIRQIYQS